MDYPTGVLWVIIVGSVSTIQSVYVLSEYTSYAISLEANPLLEIS